MTVFLIFALGALLGLVVGALACVRLVRQELTAHISPTLGTLNQRVSAVQERMSLLHGELTVLADKNMQALTWWEALAPHRQARD